MRFDVDIPCGLMVFGGALTESVLQNFILFRTCYQTLGYNQTICANLSGHPSIEKEVQPLTTELLMAKTIATSILPAVLSMFLGPWSDKHGRKPLIIAPILGYCICYLFISLFTVFPEASPWFIVASYIPVALLGGLSILLTGVFCYISDRVAPNQRAVRIGILQGSIYLGLLLGPLSSQPLFNAVGYTGVFLTGAITFFLSAIYTMFLLPESVKLDQNREGIKGLLNFKHCADVFKAAFKQRPSNNRFIIWVIICTLALMMFAMDGRFEIDYLYVREKFHWGLKEYAKFNSISMIVQVSGTMTGIYFLNKICNISEVVLGILSFSSAAMACLVRSFATDGWQLYSAIPLSLFESMAGPMCRTLLSKTVPENESGKVFAMASSIEALMPLIAAPAYTFVYNNSLTTFSGACYVLTAGVNILAVLLFMTLLCSKRADVEDLQPVINEVDDELESSNSHEA